MLLKYLDDMFASQNSTTHTPIAYVIYHHITLNLWKVPITCNISVVPILILHVYLYTGR